MPLIFAAARFVVADIKKEKVNSMKNNNSNGTNGMHNNTKNINNFIPLTREHQVRVGTPRGVSNFFF